MGYGLGWIAPEAAGERVLVAGRRLRVAGDAMWWADRPEVRAASICGACAQLLGIIVALILFVSFSRKSGTSHHFM